MYTETLKNNNYLVGFSHNISKNSRGTEMGEMGSLYVQQFCATRK
jgi:hypothetical protein